jgi:hypothetical protein
VRRQSACKVWRRWLSLPLLSATALVCAEPAPGEPYRPGFPTCAAYFFLAARGHDAARYDALYRAGEFALNTAITAQGRPAAEARMGSESTIMMGEIDQDWRLIERLDRKYAGSCEALLRDAHFDLP